MLSILNQVALLKKGVLGPGNMMLIDTTSGKLMRNEEVKAYYAAQHPYKEWVDENIAHLTTLRLLN